MLGSSPRPCYDMSTCVLFPPIETVLTNRPGIGLWSVDPPTQSARKSDLSFVTRETGKKFWRYCWWRIFCRSRGFRFEDWGDNDEVKSSFDELVDEKIRLAVPQ